MNYPHVCILILNYNRAQDTIDCINSLRSVTYPEFDIIVVDNCSTDNSAEILRQIADITFYQTEENLGYTGGINFCIEKAVLRNPEFILLLNNDTLVRPDFLNYLVQGMVEDHSVAIAGGLILAEHDRETVWYAGGKLIKWRGLAVHYCKGKKLTEVRRLEKQRVSFITGCMMLIRTSTLKRIGKQDDRFFMYLDDIEYSARVQKNGYHLLFVPEAVIYHKVLNEKESTFKLYYSVRNRLLLIQNAFEAVPKFIAYIYFLSVIVVKLVVWRFKNPPFYLAAKMGMQDFFRKRFYKGRGIDYFL